MNDQNNNVDLNNTLKRQIQNYSCYNHRFSEWTKRTFVTWKTFKVNNGFGAYPITHQWWIRVCDKCGYIDIVTKEPTIERQHNNIVYQKVKK